MSQQSSLPGGFITMRTFTHILAFLPVALFVIVAAYYVYAVVRLFTQENIPRKFSWRARAFLACVLTGFAWLLTEFILFGILGNAAEGHIRDGKFYVALGRGNYAETTHLWWWCGGVAIWITRILFSGSLLALLVTLWTSRSAGRIDDAKGP